MVDDGLDFGYLGYSTVTREILDGIDVDPALVISFEEEIEREYGRGVTYEEYEPWIRVPSVNSAEAIAAMDDHEIDVLLVMGWPELLDAETLEVPAVGCVGRHLSLLPERRGRAPVAWALIHGLRRTGVSLFWLDEGVDSGPIVDQAEVEIAPTDHARDLHRKCTEATISLLNERVLPRFRDGDFSADAQDHDDATYTHPRRPDMGLVDWTNSAWEVHNFVRGQSRPYPGAFTYDGMDRVTLWRSRLVHETAIEAAPGTVLESGDDRNEWVVQCGEGLVDVTVEYAEGADPLAVGDRLGAVRY